MVSKKSAHICIEILNLRWSVNVIIEVSVSWVTFIMKIGDQTILQKVGDLPFRAVMVKERKGSHHGQDSAPRTEVLIIVIITIVIIIIMFNIMSNIMSNMSKTTIVIIMIMFNITIVIHGQDSTKSTEMEQLMIHRHKIYLLFYEDLSQNHHPYLCILILCCPSEYCVGLLIHS